MYKNIKKEISSHSSLRRKSSFFFMVYTIILDSTNDTIAIYPRLFRSRTTYFQQLQKAIPINNQAVNFYKHVIISIFVHIYVFLVKYAILRVKSTGVKISQNC